MNQNFSPESNSEQYKVKSELNSDKTNINKALTNISEQFNPPEEKSTDSLLNLTTAEEDVLNGSNTDLETDSEHNLIRKLSQKQLKLKIVTILTSAVVMLPILILGTATYYFGNKAINRQAILARRTDNTGISQIELAKQRQLLATLLIGTGTTALMAGIFTAFVANRTFRSMSKRNTVIVKPKAEPKQINPQKSIAQLLDYLNQSFDRESIMSATVEEAQRLLECDRVVIYRFNHNNCAEVIAEAVVPGWIKAIGLTIKDSCFETDYKEKCLDGRVKIVDNIDDVNLEPCYVEQLKKLEIKANLVAPIIHQERLFGLLAAHQCSQSRSWQPNEVELLTRLAQRVSFVLDNTKLLAESKLLKEQAETEVHWTQCLSDVVRHMRQSLQKQDILDVSVEEVRRVLNCDRVVVYSLNEDDQGVVIAESVAPGFTRALGLTIEDPCFEARYLEKYQNGRVKAIDNVYEADMMACYLEQLEKLEVKANLVTPIIHEGNLFGLLVAHQCANPRSWQQQEILWLTQIAAQVGFALDNAKLLKQLEDNKLPSPPSQNPNLQKLAQDRDSQEKSAQKQNIPTKTPVPKREISGLLLESKKGFETLLLKVNEQSDLIAQFLVQMQKVTELAQALETTEPSLSSSANLEVEQDEVEAKINTTSFKDNLIKVADKITQSAQEIKQINSSAKKLYQIGNLINKLIQQIDQQITDTALQLDELERNNRRSFVSIAKRVKPLTYQLSIQTQQVETLMGEISVIAQEIINVLNFNADHTSGVTKATKGTQNLIQLNAAINAKVQTLRGKITQVVEQTQNLAVVSQFILQVATSAGNALPIRA